MVYIARRSVRRICKRKPTIRKHSIRALDTRRESLQPLVRDEEENRRQRSFCRSTCVVDEELDPVARVRGESVGGCESVDVAGEEGEIVSRRGDGACEVLVGG